MLTINKFTGLLAQRSAIHVPKQGISHQPIQGPDTIVIHYTAGSSAESAVNWLANPTSKVSAHIVIDRSGKIYQIIPFNKVAWHAGKSEYGGRNGFNSFSIGIELCAGTLSRHTAHHTG
jgi:N-acetylmuramoyl-L-alanine amidase